MAKRQSGISRATYLLFLFGYTQAHRLLTTLTALDDGRTLRFDVRNTAEGPIRIIEESLLLYDVTLDHELTMVCNGTSARDPT